MFVWGVCIACVVWRGVVWRLCESCVVCVTYVISFCESNKFVHLECGCLLISLSSPTLSEAFFTQTCFIVNAC